MYNQDAIMSHCPLRGCKGSLGLRNPAALITKMKLIASICVSVLLPASSSLQCQEVFTLRNRAAWILCICHCVLVIRCWKSIPVILDLHVLKKRIKGNDWLSVKEHAIKHFKPYIIHVNLSWFKICQLANNKYASV